MSQFEYKIMHFIVNFTYFDLCCLFCQENSMFKHYLEYVCLCCCHLYNYKELLFIYICTWIYVSVLNYVLSFCFMYPTTQSICYIWRFWFFMTLYPKGNKFINYVVNLVFDIIRLIEIGVNKSLYITGKKRKKQEFVIHSFY